MLFFGGLAGIIAGASKLRLGNVVPGVAIATALMPPLCTMGYGISHLNWQYSVGALYLFMINSVFIALATYFVVTILRFPKVEEQDAIQKKRLHFIIPLIVTLMIAPSIYLTYHIVQKYFYTNNAERFVKNEIDDGTHVVVTSKMNYKPRGSTLEIVVLGEIYDSLELKSLNEKLKNYDLDNCKLSLYQGANTRAAVEGMFNILNTDVKLTKTSIRNIYLSIDSLQRKVNKQVAIDTLQAVIARELQKKDTTLTHLSLQRIFSYNPSRNTNDTLWVVNIYFQKPITGKQKRELETWLSDRLKSEFIKLEVN